MIQRCTNQNHPKWRRYGERGIKVCARWLLFANFFADMGARPSPDHSIDRKDNDGNYEPGNCRWATRKEQQRNLGTNVVITHDGRSQCLAAWAEELGVPMSSLRMRLCRGDSVEHALNTPMRKRAKQ
jgi:hypothetical protein